MHSKLQQKGMMNLQFQLLLSSPTCSILFERFLRGQGESIQSKNTSTIWRLSVKLPREYMQQDVPLSRLPECGSQKILVQYLTFPKGLSTIQCFGICNVCKQGGVTG